MNGYENNSNSVLGFFSLYLNLNMQKITISIELKRNYTLDITLRKILCIVWKYVCRKKKFRLVISNIETYPFLYRYRSFKIRFHEYQIVYFSCGSLYLCIIVSNIIYFVICWMSLTFKIIEVGSHHFTYTVKVNCMKM